MRVIAGEWRGRKLLAPRNDATRPTADRTRETLFSMLASRLGSFEGLHVADLFAGSGALGIEALSRGAASAVFVDSHPASLALLQRNLAALGLEATARIVRGDARHLPRAPSPADLLFLDPPYGQDLIPPVLAAARAQGWVKSGSVIVLETAAAETIPLPAWLTVEKDRTIGDTRLMIAIAVE